MRTNKLPSTLREQVKENFNLQCTDGKMFNEKQLFSMMSPTLRREIQQFNCRVVMQKVPLFSRVENKSFAEDICLALMPVCVQENEIIMKENSIGHEIFFIENGIVDIFLARTKEESVYMSIGDGCYFGDVSVLTKCKRTASARASTKCYLYKLDQEVLFNVFKDYPDVAKTMHTVAKRRRRRLQNYLAPLKFPLMTKDFVDTEDRGTALFSKDKWCPAELEVIKDISVDRRGGMTFCAEPLFTIPE